MEKRVIFPFTFPEIILYEHNKKNIFYAAKHGLNFKVNNEKWTGEYSKAASRWQLQQQTV